MKMRSVVVVSTELVVVGMDKVSASDLHHDMEHPGTEQIEVLEKVDMDVVGTG